MKKKSNKAFFILVNITNINLTHQFSFIEMVYKINMAKKLFFIVKRNDIADILEYLNIITILLYIGMRTTFIWLSDK